jgi:ATP-binding cassette subfamily F protein 3
MALNEFEGTVMLVSHDRALLRAVCDEFWLVGRGEIKPFDGDLDDYQRYLLDESKRLREEAKANEANEASASIQMAKPAEAIKAAPIEAKPVVPNRTPEQKKQDALLRQQKSALEKPLKKSIEQADQKMAQLEAQKLALETKLTTPLPPPEIAEVGKQLKTIQNELENLEVQWLAWTEELEQLSASA